MVSPLITRVIAYLLSGMIHQVQIRKRFKRFMKSFTFDKEKRYLAYRLYQLHFWLKIGGSSQ